MKPPPFDYHRAGSVDEAVALLSKLGDEAKLVAGGQSLAAMLNLRLVRPTALVDVLRIPGLAYVRDDEGGGLRVGALTRHRAIERHPALFDGFAVLAEAARWVGHYPIRVRGTFGGSIAHADGSAEWCLLARLLDAEIVAVSLRGRRSIPAREFFLGLFTTALEPDELVVEVAFPTPPRHAALLEFARRHGDFAIVAAAVAGTREGDRLTGGRVVLGGVSSRPERVGDVEGLLADVEVSDEAFAEAAEVCAQAVDPPGDVHGDSEYRRDLVRTLVRRALWQACGEHEEAVA